MHQYIPCEIKATHVPTSYQLLYTGVIYYAEISITVSLKDPGTNWNST